MSGSDDIFTQQLPQKAGDPLIYSFVRGDYTCTIEVTYLLPTEEMQFKVEMPNNTYVSLGFGKGMRNVDMMAWHG